MTQPSILVRSLRHDDIEPLIHLSRETINTHYREFLGHDVVDVFLDQGAVAAFIEDSLECCRILQVDGAIAGYGICHDGLIEMIMIDPEHQRQGLGRILLGYLEQEQFHVADRLLLDSFEGNTAANSFFRDCGWEEIEQVEDPDSGIRKLVFQKMKPEDFEPVATFNEIHEDGGHSCGGSEDNCGGNCGS